MGEDKSEQLEIIPAQVKFIEHTRVKYDLTSTRYSLIETAKANALEPHAYLRSILTELPKLGRHSEPDKLLPWNCSKKIRCLQ